MDEKPRRLMAYLTSTKSSCYAEMEVTPGHRLDPRISPRVIWVGRQIVDVAVLRIGSNIIDLGLSYQSYEGKACAPSSVLFELAMHLKRERHSVGAGRRTLTGKALDTHPFAAQLDTCQNPDAVSNLLRTLLRTQTQAFSKFRKGDERLMAWLDPTIHILFTFSDTLGEDKGQYSMPRGGQRGWSRSGFEPAKALVRGLPLPRPPSFRHEWGGGKLPAQPPFEASDGAPTVLTSQPFSPAKTIFTGIGVLLGAVRDVVASHDTLVYLFERIHFFLQHLKSYTGMPLTNESRELLGKIMAQLLSILALSTKAMTDRRIRDQVQRKFRSWLSPPDPSVDHITACKTKHSGTTTWFIQGSTFQDWKKNGSLLWVRGNPGAGESILCSAIIENIKDMREVMSALVAYYYFDFKDASKRNVRGLLASLLFQLSDDSDRCWDVLYKLYTSCHDGSEQPSDVALAGYLENALEECPNTTGTPSAREEVLDFLEGLVGLSHSNLFLCVTSRPEQDIQSVLNPLTPASCQVSLHEEGGQREDIIRYVHFFVNRDRAMRRWREEDNNLVITTLIERAGGMFRWVFCQLNTLRRCMPSIVAIRPLRVEELAELFAIEFDRDVGPNLREGWRPENAEDAVLSACSTLIAVIESMGSKVVQFSHFSVKEYLTSDRLRTSEIGNIRHYHIPLDAAHTILARACLTVLLQLDESVDKKRLEEFPLAFYAAQHWVDHAKYEGVASRIQDAMEQLFNPKRPARPEATALYYAVLCGFSGLANYLILTHEEDVNAKCGSHGTPLHAASYKGHPDAVRLLLAHGVYLKTTDIYKRTPLCSAYYGGHLDVMRLLLEHGADVDVYYDRAGLLSHEASLRGRAEVVHLLLQHNADVNARSDSSETPLHHASIGGQASVAELLLEHGALVNARDTTNSTPCTEHRNMVILTSCRYCLGTERTYPPREINIGPDAGGYIAWTCRSCAVVVRARCGKADGVATIT
ncbi:hypothetical protein DFH94DRAFT_680479 [Russula ochroleuca]|uniref:Nephrocystin 3-like N-terminal domain-containing protein n=1 Tax=Russula ochroleuca TaxID=152965 RepID=A0A9P5MZB0_9AGAM|nr:hypothetical protein DFH94DRAFT_680479 [Russula ochroleuca]